MSFSERVGIKQAKTVLQTASIEPALRNRLWDVFQLYLPTFHAGDMSYNPDFCHACKILWHNYFKRPMDTIPTWPEQAVADIRQYFFGCEWNEVYDLMEFMVSRLLSSSTVAGATSTFNAVLAEELSAYRFVDRKLAPISSKEANQAIEGAIARTSDQYSQTSEHLRQAITLLSRKPLPDYRNSIKESISAVEGLCAVVTGDKKATLGQALKVIGKDAPLHGALLQAFDKLYGYTSDANGIRHALMEDADLKQEDAVFMLVACSAFVSYLIAKRARKSN